MTTYEHWQVAYFAVVVLSLVIALTLFLMWIIGGGPAPTVVCVIVAAVLFVFMVVLAVLHTRVDDYGVSWALTFGYPGGFVPFSHITTIERTTLNFIEGYASGGAWTMRHGWLWHAGGRDAVMIFTTDGRRITLGTNEPQQLYDAIVERLSKPIV